MPTKTNPGEFDCLAKALPDEPYFVLLARDPVAAVLVEEWGQRRMQAIARGKRPEEDMRQAQEALDLAQAMKAWREANGGKNRTNPPTWRVPR
jgi:hypothetical protein